MGFKKHAILSPSALENMLVGLKAVFRHGFEEKLDSFTQSEFSLLNAAYHHMALLQIYDRKPQPACHAEMNYSVQQILFCLSSISFLDQPCPVVAALPPLFVAGFYSRSQPDRDLVVVKMPQMESHHGMGNVRSSRMLVQKFWALSTTGSLGDSLLMERLTEQYWDIIPIQGQSDKSNTLALGR
ncbi:MAG: hypothetical protein M1818_005517 [Claussenomyces sp. TS43310]|nr:MAG: hypothetical protein M1818_005517 [Claussenomyces sp. TS43310]